MKSHTEWIKKRFDKLGWNEESKRQIYLEFTEFIKATGSLMFEGSFKRRVREVLNGEGAHEADVNTSRFETQIFGNNLISTYTGPRIVDKDQLMKLCDIDEDEWNVDVIDVSKHEVPRKNREVHIERGGEGESQYSVHDHGNMVVVPLFRVKIHAVRRVLKPCVLPELKKIEIKNKFKIQKPKVVGGVNTAVVLADAQMGFYRDMKTGKLVPLHDRRVFSVALDVIKTEQPEVVVLNGDFFDFADLSDKFISSSGFYHSIQPAIIEFAWWMSEIRKASPDSRMVYLAGNHEERLQLHIHRHSAFAHELKSVDRLDAYDVLSIPNLASFDELGIEWIGNYKQRSNFWLTDNFKITHGTMSSGKAGLAVKNIIRDSVISQLVGHGHKFEHAMKVIENGDRRREIEVWMLGTMCRVDGIVPSHTGFVNWQQGFGVIDFVPGDDKINPSVTPVIVNDGACLYGKSVIYGEDNSKQLAEDTGWDTLDISENSEIIDNLYFK